MSARAGALLKARGPTNAFDLKTDRSRSNAMSALSSLAVASVACFAADLGEARITWIYYFISL